MVNGLDLRQFVVCPLSEGDLVRLEAAAQRPLTPGVRRFLEVAGFPQNVVPAMFQDESAFVGAQQRVSHDAFVFAEPGESLLAERHDGVIVEIDGLNERVAFDTFDDLLAEFVSEPDDPSTLCWAIQLSFSTL